MVPVIQNLRIRIQIQNFLILRTYQIQILIHTFKTKQNLPSPDICGRKGGRSLPWLSPKTMNNYIFMRQNTKLGRVPIWYEMRTRSSKPMPAGSVVRCRTGTGSSYTNGTRAKAVV
jgi:hypothetical protein